METWKDVVGYENLYEVSDQGRIRSSRNCSKIMGQRMKNKGYLQVLLSKDGVSKYKSVHRIVAEAFIPNPNGYPIVNHMDEDKTNNRADNLEWCDTSYNIRYSASRKQRNCKNTGKRVVQRNLDGSFVKEWRNSRTISLETGMSDWSISECCRGKRKTAHGFKWEYST